MITEDYVSFETAKLLKEKGFDSDEVGCFGGFYSESCYESGHGITTQSGQEVGIVYDDLTNSDLVEYDEYLRPTLQMAMKWLRVVHKLGVFPTTFYREMGNKVKHDYGSTIVRLDTFEVIGNKNVEDYTFAADTYEETAEKALKYCLENLI